MMFEHPQVVMLQVVDLNRDTVDWDSWTVMRDAIIAVHEVCLMGDRDPSKLARLPLGYDVAKCKVVLVTGQELACRNDYRELCESLWPNSTGYVAELEHRIEEAAHADRA